MLRRLDELNNNRRKSAAMYDSLLSDIEGLTLPKTETSEFEPVYHLYVIRSQHRDSLKRWLEGKGIECGIHYPLPIHLQPIYKKLYGFRGGEYPEGSHQGEVSRTRYSE